MKKFLLIIVIVDPKTQSMEFAYSRWEWKDEAFREGVEKFNDLKSIGIAHVSYRVYDIEKDEFVIN